jgi:putative transferase (TIGR04331 family)
MQKTDIIIIDHPSTPIYEALFLNKPTVIFWNKNLNFTNQYSKRLLSELSKNKILFFSPKNAALQLNKYLKNQNSVNKLWYKNIEIQKLVKKIKNQLLNSKNINKDASILDQWNNFLEKKIKS